MRARAANVAWAVLSATLLAGLAAACKKPDTAYCRTSADCRARGEAESFCDIAGRFGPAHSCVEPPPGSGTDAGVSDTSQDAADDVAPDAPFDAGDDVADASSDKGAETGGGCRQDEQCPGLGLCDESTGLCATMNQAIFVSAAGAGGAAACDDAAGAPGSMSTPFCTVGRALEEPDGRLWVVVAAGTYAESLTVDAGDTERRRIVTGRGQAVVLRAAGDNPAVAIAGNFKLTLEDLTIAGDGTGDGAAAVEGAHGISCLGIATTPTISLARTTIRGASGYGIDAYGCDVVLDRVQIVLANHSGVRLSNSGITATNTVIARNGGAGVEALGLEPESKRLLHVTIAHNVGAGVECGFPMTVENTIVFGNASAFSGMCAFAWSDVQDAAPAGDGNSSADPIFKDPAALDFHLGAASSPCVDRGGVAGAPDHDLDGDPRPRGAGLDTGADEAF